MTNARALVILSMTVVFAAPIKTQILGARSFIPGLSLQEAGAQSPLSNTVTDIVVSGDTIWLGTGKGLSRSTDDGTTWKNFYGTDGFGEEDISAIALHGAEVWVATAHTVTINDESMPEGSGLHYSSDGGATWKYFPQPRDTTNVDTLYYNAESRVRALGITTAINNITYDIAATDSAVWITSFAGMVRKSTDKGLTWHRVIIPPDYLSSLSPTDTVSFDLSPTSGSLGLTGNFNHRAFSLFAENDTVIWIGTADGINKTTDGGRSWLHFKHQNESSPISGNFVVALEAQSVGTQHYLWAATVNANAAEEVRGISVSSDGGSTWSSSLHGEFVHGIGINGPVVYAVTDNGIFRTTTVGKTWVQAGTIIDPVSQERVWVPAFYAAAVLGPNAWFGGSDGVVYTPDTQSEPFGSRWRILHSSPSVSGKKTTYCYPNPFSPDDEVVRIHYAIDAPSALVTIRIFDFGMSLVRTLISNALRTDQTELDEVWNGRDDSGRQVSNGPYFYAVQIADRQPLWGKILVLQ